MTQETDPRALPGAPFAVDLAGERLLRGIDAACDPSASFAAQVEAALRVAFDLVSTRTDVLCLLPDFENTEAVTVRQGEWQQVLATRIRDAAEHAAPVAHPPIVDYLLVGALQSQVRRWLNRGRPTPLAEQIPGTLEFVCAYYGRPSSSRLTIGCPSY